MVVVVVVVVARVRIIALYPPKGSTYALTHSQLLQYAGLTVVQVTVSVSAFSAGRCQVLRAVVRRKKKKTKTAVRPFVTRDVFWGFQTVFFLLLSCY